LTMDKATLLAPKGRGGEKREKNPTLALIEKEKKEGGRGQQGLKK